MPEPKRNLWGDLDPAGEAPIHPVVGLLREQAAVLAEMTRGRITAEVSPVGRVDRFPVTWRFVLVAPLARGFRFDLFDVEQPGPGFPVEIQQETATGPRAWPCADEAAFERHLGDVLKSDYTRQALASVRTLDQMAGRSATPFEFTDAAGDRHLGELVIEPLPAGTVDGTHQQATVLTPAGVQLQMRVAISGAARGARDDTPPTGRIADAARALLARGVRHDLDTPTPVVQVFADRTTLLGPDGKTEPL